MQDCRIIVEGGSVLELRVNCPGFYDSAHTVWLDPYLVVPGPGSAPTEGATVASKDPSPEMSPGRAESTTVGPVNPADGSSRPANPPSITNSIGMTLKLIPAGQFLMGSGPSDKDGQDNEKPSHSARITRPFYLGIHEVTRGQFRRFVDDAGYRTEAEKDGKGGFGWNEGIKSFQKDNPRYTWRNPGFEQTDQHPVVNVGWNDAVAFAQWLGRKEGKAYRLPTEAEWEYACRAGTKSAYSFGDDPEGLAAVANVLDRTATGGNPSLKKIADVVGAMTAHDRYVYTAPVGRFRPNAWGLYDMHGNVWEWCADWYDSEYYKRAPLDDPPGPDGASLRVYRGGSWMNGPIEGRSASRFQDGPVFRSLYLGFRLARVPSDR
jgi:formylglycine-generating enzyme required for sulfatase activity